MWFQLSQYVIWMVYRTHWEYLLRMKLDSGHIIMLRILCIGSICICYGHPDRKTLSVYVADSRRQRSYHRLVNKRPGCSYDTSQNVTQFRNNKGIFECCYRYRWLKIRTRYLWNSLKLTMVFFWKDLKSGLGICGTALNWFKSYLSGRPQSVLINGTQSKPT